MITSAYHHRYGRANNQNKNDEKPQRHKEHKVFITVNHSELILAMAVATLWTLTVGPEHEQHHPDIKAISLTGLFSQQYPTRSALALNTS